MKENGYHAYQRTDIITADPKKLVIMCYDGAIQSLKIAKSKYESNDYEAKTKAIQNVLDIISELRESLDFERGGDIAKYLDSIYSFMTRFVIKADRERDLKTLDHIVAMLEDLKSAWEQIFYGRPESVSLASKGVDFTPTRDSKSLQYQGI